MRSRSRLLGLFHRLHDNLPSMFAVAPTRLVQPWSRHSIYMDLWPRASGLPRLRVFDWGFLYVRCCRCWRAESHSERDRLDPATGAQLWTTDLGTPWNPLDIACGDIAPAIGTTATPVIDPSTNTAYLTHKTYASGSSGPAAWFMDALDASSGHERPGFPVPLDGAADNAPSTASCRSRNGSRSRHRRRRS